MKLNLRHSVLALFVIGAFALSVSASTAPTFEIGTWANFCQGAVSHTFDDNTTGQYTVAQPLFDAKGLHMTFFVITGQSPAWDKYKAAFAKGHEIASHSVTHPQTMSDAECPTSQNAIKQNVPGEKCITVAYPNCNEPSPTTNLKKCYIAGRICDGNVGAKTPGDFWRVSCKMAGSAGVNTASGLDQGANDAASSGGWMVWCHHGVGNDGHGYSNTATAALQGDIDFLDKNRSKIWCETFGNVSRYIYERNASPKVNVASSTADKITLTVTNTLTDSMYNYPLSVRCEAPSGWTSATVKQGAKTMADTIITVSSKTYLMFQAVPNAGEVVLSKGGADNVLEQRIGFSSAMTSPIVKLQHGALVIDKSQLGGSNLSLAIFDLNGKELVRHGIGGGESHIAIPIGKIMHSAFIAKVSGNGKIYVRTFLPQL
jgi:hypothetical protein